MRINTNPWGPGRKVFSMISEISDFINSLIEGASVNPGWTIAIVLFGLGLIVIVIGAVSEG